MKYSRATVKEPIPDKPTILSVQVVWEQDENPDLSDLGEYSNTPKEGAIDRRKRKGFQQGEYRYFNPATEYGEQDYERMEAFNNYQWASMGCWAEAEVGYSIGGNGIRIEILQSGGLWGIESDSDQSYFEEVARDELEDLKHHLEKFGIDTSKWDELTQDIDKKP